MLPLDQNWKIQYFFVFFWYIQRRKFRNNTINHSNSSYASYILYIWLHGVFAKLFFFMLPLHQNQKIQYFLVFFWYIQRGKFRNNTIIHSNSSYTSYILYIWLHGVFAKLFFFMPPLDQNRKIQYFFCLLLVHTEKKI